MSIKQKSFEEFFYTEDNRICNVEMVSDYADKHDGDYLPYKGNMMCPECQKAELTFVHKSSNRRAHLKKIPSANHLENCSYIYEYAPKKLVKTFVDNLSYNQIQDRLNAIMNMLFNNNGRHNIDNDNANNRRAEDNPFLIPNRNNEQIEFKALRRKRLAGWIDESDGTGLYLFYGKAKLSVEQKVKTDKDGKKYSYHFLKIKLKNKKGEWKDRTSIYRGSINDKVDKQAVYQIALIGNLKFNDKWWNIELINKDAIRLRIINE